MLILKNKIGSTIPGTPTMSDKYDVITAVVGATKVVAGQFVDYGDVFNGTNQPLIKPVTTASVYVGVVSHQNVKVEGFNDNTGLQTFNPGDVIGVITKGFVLAIGDKTFTSTGAKLKDGFLTNETTGIQTPLANWVVTGSMEESKKLDKKLVEVELR